MCLPDTILSIKKDIPSIGSPKKPQGPKTDWTQCYLAWRESLPGHWMAITCADDRIASRVVSAFYDRVSKIKGFPAPTKTVRRGAVVYMLKGEV